MIHDSDPQHQPPLSTIEALCPTCGCPPLLFDVRLSSLLDAALVLEEQARTVRRIVEEVLP